MDVSLARPNFLLSMSSEKVKMIVCSSHWKGDVHLKSQLVSKDLGFEYFDPSKVSGTETKVVFKCNRDVVK